jgi:hypothetical protein
VLTPLHFLCLTLPNTAAAQAWALPVLLPGLCHCITMSTAMQETTKCMPHLWRLVTNKGRHWGGVHARAQAFSPSSGRVLDSSLNRNLAACMMERTTSPAHARQC